MLLLLSVLYQYHFLHTGVGNAGFVGGWQTFLALLQCKYCLDVLPSLSVTKPNTHLCPCSARQTPQRPKFEFINESKDLPNISVSWPQNSISLGT